MTLCLQKARKIRIYMDGNAFTKLIKDEGRDFAIYWADGNNIGVSIATQK